MSIEKWLRGTQAAVARWLRAPAGPSAARVDPAARMFGGIRRRLTLWYTAVLAAILLIAGLLLYLGMQQQLLGPVSGVLQSEAAQQAQLWQAGTPPTPCVIPTAHQPLPYFVACYDAGGALIGANQLAALAPDFTTTSLARSALASGSATDTIAGGTAFGAIQRYALAVRDPSGQVLGVIQIGYDIGAEADALHTLLVLLLAVGALTLIGCGIGGALLAARTLAPARLAFDRQQAFIADASHELRSPLTLLRADAEVLLRGRDQLDPQDAPLLDDIVAEVEHMSAIAENLLMLARLDAGVYHIEREVVDLASVARDVAERAHALAAERGIRVTVEAAPGALVIGDPTRLAEAALILLDNAIKYNQPGGSVVLRTAREGQQVTLAVRDTGIGIPSEHLARLGERFYRVDKARARQMGGAGLGLAIARGIAALHGGSLTLASALGEGTTATLRLPAATVPAES